jgi:hypothetical protein
MKRIIAQPRPLLLGYDENLWIRNLPIVRLDIRRVGEMFRLHRLLMADLLLPENALPIDTKQSLLNVAHFVRRHSMQLLSGNGELADLIEVNRTIMAGISPARGNLGEVAA